MRNWRKMIALLIALVLVMGLVMSSAVAEPGEKEEKSGIIYTCLGDSIAAGYSLPGFEERRYTGLTRMEGTYGAIVADSLNVDKYNAYAMSGVRTQEMKMFLVDDYYGDAITNRNMWFWFLDTDNIEPELAALRKQLREGIREANLITLGIGANDLLLTLEGTLLQLGTGKPYQGPEAAVQEYVNQVELNGLEDTNNMVSTALEYVMGVATLVPQLIAAASDAVLGFNSRYEEDLNLIQKLNPTAAIVQVSQYNPFYTLSPGFDGIFDMYFGQMNDFFLEMAEKYDNVYYADVTGTETIFGTQFINDPHPTQNGHKYMAEQILKVLEDVKIPDAPTVTPSSDPKPTETVKPTETAKPTETVKPTESPAPSEGPKDKICAPYKDIDTTQWYHNAVHYAIENKIMAGLSADTFAPHMSVTRGMMAQMIYAMEGRPIIWKEQSYKDVEKGRYYEDAVAFVSQNKIMTGYNEDTFGPGDPITREQLATLLRGYANYLGKSTSVTADITGYADYRSVSEWAVTSMEWAVGSGIIAGRDGNKLAPLAKATRAEVAQMLMKFKDLK